jgi:hypothetical protein
MARRLLHDWLTSYLTYTTSSSESPVSFHLWSGMSTLAAALQRKVYLKWGHTTIYPNQYIILVGPSGRSRKGEPIGIAREMAKSLKIEMLAEDNSLEWIAREMANAVTSYTDATTGKVTYQCAVSSFTEELSVFTGEQNTRLLSYLTNWYDSRSDWTRGTKHQGIDDIQGVCLNLLSATAPDWIPYIFPRAAVGGGFTSRCLFIVEERKGKVVPNPNLPELQPPRGLKSALKHDLEIIHTITGAYELSPKALSLYEQWYVSEEKRIESGNHDLQDPMLSGYLSRRSTHLFKLGIALTASRTRERVIGEKDFNRALTMLRMIEKKMPRVFSGIGKARYIEETELVLHHLQTHGSAKKSDLLRRYMRILDITSLDAVMTVLRTMNVITATIKPGEDTIYTYKEKGNGEVIPFRRKGAAD